MPYVQLGPSSGPAEKPFAVAGADFASAAAETLAGTVASVADAVADFAALVEAVGFSSLGPRVEKKVRNHWNFWGKQRATGWTACRGC